MVYAPPLIKPPLPPLRPPVAPPYRPPGPNRLPPTQPAPIYQPPNLLPPTDLDLKGIVCVYSNAPKWEPKKIRYRYPGENWKEIAGDRYTLEIDQNSWLPLPLTLYTVYFSAKIWCWDNSGVSMQWTQPVTGGFYLKSRGFTNSAVIRRFNTPDNVATINGETFEIWHKNGIEYLRILGIGPNPVIEFTPFSCPGTERCNRNQEASCINIPGQGNLSTLGLVNRQAAALGSVKVDRVVRASDNQEIFPTNKCTFKVFNILNQEILSITRDDCPEVIVVPERCYFKDENERLVRKVNISFFQDLEAKYNGHCATVLLKSYPLPLPVEIYKECSDNPNCPPPRIRFDKKCEEKCEQCPPGTAIKVLLGSRIACVDAVGCVLKSIKYKPGCNNYDCICS